MEYDKIRIDMNKIQVLVYYLYLMKKNNPVDLYKFMLRNEFLSDNYKSMNLYH